MTIVGVFSLSGREYATFNIDFKPVARLTAPNLPRAGLTLGQL